MLTPHRPYFLIRIIKEEQKNRQGKIGNIIIPPQFVFGGRGLQSGQIVSIGTDAAKEFPEAKIGNILLFHWFVEFKDTETGNYGNFLVDEDEIFKYYLVTSKSYNGRKNESYGVFNGKEIIPHKDYAFFETDPPEQNDLPPDEAIRQATMKTEGGILLFKKWGKVGKV